MPKAIHDHHHPITVQRDDPAFHTTNDDYADNRYVPVSYIQGR